MNSIRDRLRALEETVALLKVRQRNSESTGAHHCPACVASGARAKRAEARVLELEQEARILRHFVDSAELAEARR